MTTKDNFDIICEEILTERKRQDAKFNEQNHDPMKWCVILGEEVGEVNKAALEKFFNYKGIHDYSAYREELIQCAAVCVAAIQSLDRNEKRIANIDPSFQDKSW